MDYNDALRFMHEVHIAFGAQREYTGENAREKVIRDLSYSEEIKTIISAVEKKIPKKPHLRKLHLHEDLGFGKDIEYYECPNECDTTVLTWHRCCPNCGQVIDWSDVK